jgi:low affinity Fe/Cu permease
MKEGFDRFARAVAQATGSAWAFGFAFAACIIWAVAGPLFGWSDTWQLWANTATTIITFLMVFIIQHTQNSDTAEIKALLREIAEDLPEVDEIRAMWRAKKDEC